LLLAINAPKDLEDVVSLGVHLASLEDLHVHIVFNWCLDVHNDIVDLQGVPAIDDGQDKNKTDDDPVSYQCIHFIVIPSKDLVGSIKTELHPTFVYLLGEDVALVPHLPNSWEDSCPS